ALRAQCDAQAAELGLEAGSYEIEYGADMRYAGQGYELSVWLAQDARGAAALRAAFETEHRALYGYARDSLQVQVVNLRGRIVKRTSLELKTRTAGDPDEPRISQDIVIDGEKTSATFMARAALPAGEHIDGPAVLEEPTSTLFVPPG